MSDNLNCEFLELIEPTSSRKYPTEAEHFSSKSLYPLLESLSATDFPDEFFLNLNSNEFLFKDLVPYIGAVECFKYCEMFVRPICLPPVNFDVELESMDETDRSIAGLLATELHLLDKEDSIFLRNIKVIESKTEWPYALATNDFLIGTPFAEIQDPVKRIKYMNKERTKLILIKEEDGEKLYYYYENNGTYRRQFYKCGIYTRDIVSYYRPGCSGDMIFDKEYRVDGTITITTTDPYFIRLCDDKFNKSRRKVFIDYCNKYIEENESDIKGLAKFVSRTYTRTFIEISMKKTDNKMLGVKKRIYSRGAMNTSTTQVTRISLIMWPFWLKYFILRGGEEYHG